MYTYMKLTVSFLLLATVGFSLANGAVYAPAAGEPGSTAIHKDSAVFTQWATACRVERGYLKISDTTLTDNDTNRASHGADTNGIGKADGLLVSLGDGGRATLQFDRPITNVEGPDFAVFENSFKNNMEAPFQYFLELAFVEVSSDGVYFVRFPAYSETPALSQIGTFGQLDPTRIHNLAGKYNLFYGTPFDLSDLLDSSGIDLNAITHIRVVDVIGSTSARYASLDCLSRPINDPWPTPFASCGFDLDAVGVLGETSNPTAIPDSGHKTGSWMYPNPVSLGSTLHLQLPSDVLCTNPLQLTLTDPRGQRIYQQKLDPEEEITIELPARILPGVYVVSLSGGSYFQSTLLQLLP